ncbi:MAG: sigma-70 family RNA polymerase sigma factor, partial [Myxococcales bacterium]|nr:sigma-70 family RNA polymerase sigma factor [Myxococcales bacterium]
MATLEELEGEEPGPTAALVLAARDGDRRAFATLYRNHGRMVHGVLLARLPRAELRDALQEVFTTALAKLASLREPERFGPWLATIARNLARDWFKRRGNTRELAHEPEHFDGRPDASGADLTDALGLLAAMRELSEDYREILVLRFVAGMT